METVYTPPFNKVRNMNIRPRSKLLIIIIFFSLCGHSFAENLTISAEDLNTVPTFKKMVKYSEDGFTYNIYAVDTHTGGEPTRIVVSGLPEVKGKNMIEKKIYFKKNLDFLRTSLMSEPRGHENMFGAVITKPVTNRADIGVIFIEGGGYLDMCGHGTIGVVTAVVETGLIKVKHPFTEVNIDTPAGFVKATAKMDGKHVEEVTIKNVPSFLYEKDIIIELDGIGAITVDISYGGNFFALVDADQLKIQIKPQNVDKLIKVGMEIKDKINKAVKVKHPTLGIMHIDLVEIYKRIKDNHFKNIVVFGNGQFDRSPCGTGTSAKLADLYAKGKIQKDQDLINESIIGSVFKGKITEVTKVGKYKAIIPEITGKAWITGFNHYVIDPKDSFKYGFTIDSQAGKPQG